MSKTWRENSLSIHLPPAPVWAKRVHVLLNPENTDRILGMYHCEGKTKIEQYCLSAGFEITRSVQTECVELVFEYVEELLKWHWSTTHGVFDPSLVTEERLQKYLAPYTDENGTPCLDFRGMKHEMPVCQLLAIKKASERAWRCAVSLWKKKQKSNDRHQKLSGFRNPSHLCLRNPESWASESGIVH